MEVKLGETVVLSLKSEALNCIENLLIREEVSIETYEILRKAFEILGNDNCFDLGDGIKLKLVDYKWIVGDCEVRPCFFYSSML